MLWFSDFLAFAATEVDASQSSFWDALKLVMMVAELVNGTRRNQLHTDISKKRMQLREHRARVTRRNVMSKIHVVGVSFVALRVRLYDADDRHWTVVPDESAARCRSSEEAQGDSCGESGKPDTGF